MKQNYSDEISNSINGVVHADFQRAIDHWGSCKVNVGPEVRSPCPLCTEIDEMQAALWRFHRAAGLDMLHRGTGGGAL